VRKTALEKLTPAEFLTKFNLEGDAFETTKITWDELVEICHDFEQDIPEFEQTGLSLAKKLGAVEGVHSLKFRVKDSQHLAAKIVRKRLANADRVIGFANYRDEVTDLIGLRVLHLFKENWQGIHEFIMNEWRLNEEPTAYIREGDPPTQRAMFETGGCVVKVHKDSYRSVHYLVQTFTSTKACVAELQVRSLFEEAWSEIDHLIRYPHNLNNRVLNEFLVIFNRVAGQADEMGSFVTYLAATLNENQQIQAIKDEEVRQAKEQLQEFVHRLEVTAAEKNELEKHLLNVVSATEQATFKPSSSSPSTLINSATQSETMANDEGEHTTPTAPKELCEHFERLEGEPNSTLETPPARTEPIQIPTSPVSEADNDGMGYEPSTKAGLASEDVLREKPVRTSQQRTLDEFLDAYRRTHPKGK
jgi:ppGpp synthetase/RelA/SpoT-type nucleotidyltranferase